MRLYTHPLSTFARRVHIALLEKNIAVETHEVDMAAREHRTPEYLALNPYGRVPTLQNGDFVLFESNSILLYIDATHPIPPLAPDDARQRALIDMHLRLCDLQMAQPAGAIIFPKRFLPKERWDQAAIADAAKKIASHLEILSRQLNGQDYLVGNRYSLADIAYTPFLEFLPLMTEAVPDNISRWRERLMTRPSSAQTKPPR